MHVILNCGGRRLSRASGFRNGTRNPTTSTLLLPPTPLTLSLTTPGQGMFSSSVRRVASTAPPISTASSFSNSAQRAAASQALSYRSHQRRYSSSKPSSPADGSKGVTDGQGVAAAAAHAPPEGEKKSTRSSKKKTKDGASSGKGRDESIQNLPCVPSTHHISPNRTYF